MMQFTTQNLPTPPQDYIDRAHQVRHLLSDRIQAREGWIGFDDFMNTALYHGSLGYYRAPKTLLGRGGDFVTAPERSPLFSRCVALQCSEVLSSMPSGCLLEVGAGQGTMAAEVLNTLGNRHQLPEHYYILELSGMLIEQQKATIKAHAAAYYERVIWINKLPDEFSGVILANELLDALPTHRCMVKDGVCYELGVQEIGNELVWAPKTFTEESALRNKAESIAKQYYPNRGQAIFELNLAAQNWIRSVSQSLKQGCVLLIDYGYPERELFSVQRPEGTLRCFYQHHCHNNPFYYPGLQDITSDVNFSAIAATANTEHLMISGYTTQALFLLAMGIESMAFAGETSNQEDQWATSQALQHLMLPTEMGESFKVMALTKGLEIPLRGFSFKDLSYQL